MADKMTSRQRHRCMSRIRSKDTKPEMKVRKFLWHNGVRYRLHVKRMPGCPDIVIRRLRTAIFVNGCFWHGHKCQKHLPESNRKFWYDKIMRNRERDMRNAALLEAAGWVVIVVWECELAKPVADHTLHRLLDTIRLLESALPATPCGYSDASADDYTPLAADDEATYE
ncbi:MAG: very short patch repair endonuclease [Muribaculaceae bacterium]